MKVMNKLLMTTFLAASTSLVAAGQGKSVRDNVNLGVNFVKKTVNDTAKTSVNVCEIGVGSDYTGFNGGQSASVGRVWQTNFFPYNIPELLERDTLEAADLKNPDSPALDSARDALDDRVSDRHARMLKASPLRLSQGHRTLFIKLVGGMNGQQAFAPDSARKKSEKGNFVGLVAGAQESIRMDDGGKNIGFYFNLGVQAGIGRVEGQSGSFLQRHGSAQAGFSAEFMLVPGCAARLFAAGVAEVARENAIGLRTGASFILGKMPTGPRIIR